MMNEQILKDAEIYLLGSIFDDPRTIFKVFSTLCPEDFYDSRHGLVFATMQELAKENIPIDILSVLEKCSRNGNLLVSKNYLFEISESVSSAANMENYAEIIKKNSIQRSLLGLSKKIVGLVKEDEEPESIISKIFDELSSLDKKRGRIKNAAESIEALNDMIQNNNHIGIQTGIVALDYKITGMRSGEMIVLAAPPSVGKTALALNIANNAIMSGKVVVFFTLEMTTEEIALRLVSINSRVNLRSIMNGSINYDDREKIHAAVDRYSQTKFYIDDSSNIKVEEMRMVCNKIKCEKGALDLVVVDYLQLINPSKKENQTIAMGDISRNLKIMAKELSVPVLCLSQLNRGYKDGKISLFNLRDSGNIEQDANQVWFVYFPIMFAKDEKDKEKYDPKHARLEIAKNRNGEKGIVDLQFESEYTLFTDYNYSRLSKNPLDANRDADGFFPPDVIDGGENVK